ncbi:MAG: double-strand break repair protein AddB [Ponticaulis sp.]|nr:double-strand break repair protein AddB [Ponticaulis sp.]|tara:strand:- start:44347 stop:47439 length:3093 start_codon:yes stop_codon:yes gene_type:complete
MTSSLLDQQLFGSPDRLFTLPAGSDFLGELARSLIEITNAQATPEALANALIFVPNRRSARALAARLFQELNQPAFLPPDIRPLGDAGDNDPALLGELASIDVRPPMPAGARLGALSHMVMQWHESRGESLTLASAMSVARDLARLLDQAALSGEVAWDTLADQVENAELARHWQVSVEFLEIITRLWPDVLRENGYADTHDQDRLAAEAMCARWAHTPPATPVIIAGSTGTTPATRMLMQAAIELPKGAVLFPGLDHDMDHAIWQAIHTAPSHPQHAFSQTLTALNTAPEAVRLWPDYAADDDLTSRRKIIQEALAPADTTADWVTRLKTRAAPETPETLTRNGLQGLSLIEAETEAEEADAIALLLRETLETPDKTAALITPDAGIARRVSALLKRWDVHVSPSAGTPLPLTSAGQFLLATLDWAFDPGDASSLATILKTERIVLQCQEEETDFVSLLERGVLRGLRRWKSLDDMGIFADQQASEADEHPTRFPISGQNYTDAIHLIEELHDRFSPLLERFETLISAPFSLRAFSELLAELADALTKHPDDDGPSMLWSGSDGAATARFLEDLAFMGDWMPEIGKDDLKPFVTQLASDIRVPNETPPHPCLFIWGPLEARLQCCDRMILAGLNESTWPEAPGADGFLLRHIRAAIGLPDTEARIGLSAHDFAQLTCSRDVVLTRSLRVNDKPAVASRWLWRLRILASGALGSLDKADDLLIGRTGNVLDWVRTQHTPTENRSVDPPEPKPPKEARTKQISVTEVETLIRDPYAYYARKVLALEPLEKIDAPISPLAIGTALHNALEGVNTLETPSLTPDHLVARFSSEMTQVGADPLFLAERQASWHEVSDTFLSWMADRDGVVKSRAFEQSYRLDLSIKDKTVKLIGRADMVETLHTGMLVVTDFKTGAPPSAKQVSSGLSPQLPLLGGLAALSEDERKPSGPPAEFFYVGFGSRGGVQSVRDKDMSAEDMSQAALSGLKDLLAAYADETTPYLSGPRIQFLSAYSDFDQLSRKQEWADPGHEGEAS